MNREEQFSREVAARIRQARKEANLSQEDLGAKIGMSKVGFGHYERGTQGVHGSRRGPGDQSLVQLVCS